jgi:hypothetical protein
MNFASYCAEKRAILEAATPGPPWTDGDGLRSGFGVYHDGTDLLFDTGDHEEGDGRAKFAADSRNHRQAELEALAELWGVVEKVAETFDSDAEAAGEDYGKAKWLRRRAATARAALHHAAAKLGVEV